MNMMTMAKMEEAIRDAWEERWAVTAPFRTGRAVHTSKDAPPVTRDFEKGFRAGVAWAIRQAKTEPSSQAMGNISHCPAAVEEPEEEA